MDGLDQELVAATRRTLYSAFISDVLDTLGDMDHAVAPRVRLWFLKT